MLGVILSTIISVATTVTTALAKVALAVEGLKVVGNAIMGIAKALGIIKPERKVEDLGDRAMQAEETEGMKPTDFNSYEEWMKKIESDDWGYDPEKNKDMDVKEKINKGIEVAAAVTAEKFPDLPLGDFLTVTTENKEFFTPERFAEIGKLAKTNTESFGEIVNYVTGKEMSEESLDKAIDNLMDIEKSLKNLEDGDAYDIVASYRQRPEVY